MKLVKMGSILAMAIILSACSTAHKKGVNDAAVDQANAAYNDNQAQVSGAGEESGFGEQGANQSQGHQNNLSSRVYHFDYDSNVVHDSDRPAILANANYLVAHSNTKIILEGHTDPRGSREYNIALGERRAKAVADILTAKGVNPGQIRLVSYGAEKPAVPGHDESAYAQDRRVVLIILQG